VIFGTQISVVETVPQLHVFVGRLSFTCDRAYLFITSWRVLLSSGILTQSIRSITPWSSKLLDPNGMAVSPRPRVKTIRYHRPPSRSSTLLDFLWLVCSVLTNLLTYLLTDIQTPRRILGSTSVVLVSVSICSKCSARRLASTSNCSKFPIASGVCTTR